MSKLRIGRFRSILFSTSITAISILAISCSSNPPTAIDPPSAATIELQGVPSELRLPAAEKDNYIVTAIVHGPIPKRVWVGRTANSPYTVSIPAFGNGRYQINLADNRVVVALRRGGGNGQFYIFVEDPDGQVIQSAAIRAELAAPTANYTLYNANGDAISLNGGSNWFDVSTVRRIEVQVSPSLPGLKVQAKVGDQILDLKSKDQSDDDALYAMDFWPELLDAWQDAGEMNIECTPDFHAPSSIGLQAIPMGMDIPVEGIQIDLLKNNYVEESHEYLFFQLGTTKGQITEVTLRRADGSSDPAAGFSSSGQIFGRPHDPIDALHFFDMADGQYAWAMTDAHTVTIWKSEDAGPALLRELFRRMAEDENHPKLSYNGHDAEKSDAANQLSAIATRAKAKTVQQFLKAAHSNEDATNSKYILKNENDADPMPLADWVKWELDDMGWK